MGKIFVWGLLMGFQLALWDSFLFIIINSTSLEEFEGVSEGINISQIFIQNSEL